MNKIVLITGTTSGIGKATAYKFAQNHYDLIITGRRTELLRALADEIISKYHVDVLPLCFDIRNKESVQTAVESLDEKWKQPDVLVNNAGLALGLQGVQDGQFDDWDTMIDTNIKGLLYMSRLIAPLMIAKGKGHIINIGSIAGKEAYANGNVYCATKFAVDGLTKAMRLDLFSHGIKVSQIAPGAVQTEFSMVRFKGDSGKAKNVYQGFTPLRGEDIADAIFYVATVPDHVNINDLVIMPAAQANATNIHR